MQKSARLGENRCLLLNIRDRIRVATVGHGRRSATDASRIRNFNGNYRLHRHQDEFVVSPGLFNANQISL